MNWHLFGGLAVFEFWVGLAAYCSYRAWVGWREVFRDARQR